MATATVATSSLNAVTGILGLSGGLGLLALGAYEVFKGNASVGAAMVGGGATILVGASHSEKWLATAIADAPEADSIVQKAEVIAPHLPLPASAESAIQMALTLADTALKALAAANAKAAPAPAAQAVAAAVAAPVAPAGSTVAPGAA